MKNFNYKREIILWILLLAPVLYISYAWGQMPDRIAIHFGIDGHPNGWGNKWSAFIVPASGIFTYLLILFLPQIDPKRMGDNDYHSLFYKIRATLVIFMSAVSLVIPYLALHADQEVAITDWIGLLVFLLFAAMGNFMINIKPNWFIGVRTPWTLSSDTVWRQTHHVLGRVWFYGGLLAAALSLFTAGHWRSCLIPVFAIGSAVFAFAYSFWLYRKEKQGAGARPDSV